MYTFGVLVKHIVPTQLGLQLATNLNLLTSHYSQISPIVFNETFPQLPMPLNFPLIQNRDVWLFDGPVIATSIETAQILLQSPKPYPKFFYVWNLDWIYSKQTPLSFFTNTYLNQDIRLIARSTHHANIIENCWKKPVTIIKDFNYHDIAKLIIETGRQLSKPII